MEGLRNWEIVQSNWSQVSVNDEGRLIWNRDYEDAGDDETTRRRRALRDKVRGLIRSVVLVVDLSEPGLEPRDFGQHRARVLVNALSQFVNSFFDQSPISQMAIIATHSEGAFVLSPLCGAVGLHLRCIEGLIESQSEGWPSLQSALAKAAQILLAAPKYSTKEVLMIFGALNTSDVMPIDSTIRKLRTANVVVSVIGLGAGVFVLKRIAEETGGTYLVPMNEDHLNEILQAQLEPPPWSQGQNKSAMVRVGFVRKNSASSVAFDVSELKIDAKAMPKEGGLSCPKCGMKVFIVPVYCPSCGLLLLTPAHIGRALVQTHHVDPFVQVPEFAKCAGCQVIVNSDEDSQGMRKCGECGAVFCRECDALIHKTLHQCPMCMLTY